MILLVLRLSGKPAAFVRQLGAFQSSKRGLLVTQQFFFAHLFSLPKDVLLLHLLEL